MKQIILSLLIIIILVLGVGLFLKAEHNTEEKQTEQLSIVTSFYPLYFFASRIAGEGAIVSNLTAASIDPHDFEPSTDDLRLIEHADLLITNGLGVETWLDHLETETPILQSAIGLADIEHGRGEEMHQEEENHEEGEEEDHDHGQLDPHIWLDPVLAKAQVQVIADKISELDEINRAFYQANATKLISELDELDSEFTNALQSCQQDQIITAHDAFAYMAKRYGFEQLAIQGLNHEEEVTAAQLLELAKLAKEQQIKYVFFESLLSPKLAQTLAQEVGAEVLIFDPLESLSEEAINSGADYFSIQRQNLSNLQLALECQQ